MKPVESIVYSSDVPLVDEPVAQALVRKWEELGVRHAYGIPGGPFIQVFNALSRSQRIQCMLSKHECGAAFAALGRGLARHSDELPLCFATAGPGATNLLTGVASADHERVPMFVVTGNVATHLRGKGAVQESFPESLDVVRILEQVTARSVMLEEPERVLDLVEDLYASALRTLRPVHLNVPVDLSTVRLKTHRTRRETRRYFDRGTDLAPLRDDLQAFLASERPMIYAGNGIKTSGLQAVLQRVAEKHALPVMVTSHGKSAFDEFHPLYAGLFGVATRGESMRFLEEYRPTGCLFLGTSLNECSTAAWNPILEMIPLKIQIDRDPKRLAKPFPMEHAHVADLGDTLGLLVELPALGRKAPDLAAFAVSSGGGAAYVPDREVHPRFLLQSLDGTLPPRCRIVADIGNSMLWAIQELRLHAGQDFHVPMSLGSMGSGIGVAVGLQTSEPDTPVVCLAGDCAVLMNGAEFHTATNRRNAPLKVIVLNDGGHGTVAAGLNLLGFGERGVRFSKRVDFALWGRALHFETAVIRTNDELAAFDWAAFWTSTRPMLLDVHVDPEVPPPLDIRHKGLFKGKGAPGLISPEKSS